ncbi:hypothetical protein [Sporohalobacter salinus]|uniref:hypothetical protein n=1 Tax=Sporohalobacter salinus TaxID=1494606 RepID=UPI0019607E70|nr:hypothetical protein [Sporohalobacter salinus]MBM7623255.1 HSP20 family molecular chaperone IbpA [Sporohalobacter salinus]
MSDSNFTNENDNKKESAKEASTQNKLEGVLSGISKVFDICSEMLNNEEMYRQYEGEMENETDRGSDMKGLYKLGIKLGELGKEAKTSSKLRSIPPSKYSPSKVNVEESEEEITIKVAFKNIMKEEINIFHEKALVVNTRGGTENSKELEFSQEDYRIKEIEYKFPHLIITLIQRSKRGDRKHE